MITGSSRTCREETAADGPIFEARTPDRLEARAGPIDAGQPCCARVRSNHERSVPMLTRWNFNGAFPAPWLADPFDDDAFAELRRRMDRVFEDFDGAPSRTPRLSM